MKIMNGSGMKVLLTKRQSIECTRTIQLSCLHRSVLFDYNRSIVYFRSAKPVRAEFSNFYHLVSYALPPYFCIGLLFVLFVSLQRIQFDDTLYANFPYCSSCFYGLFRFGWFCLLSFLSCVVTFFAVFCFSLSTFFSLNSHWAAQR